MHKVQHAKEHREEAERRQQSRGHASRTPTEERQRASKAPQKAQQKAQKDQEAQRPHKAAKIHAVGSIGSIEPIGSAKTGHEKSHSSTQAAQRKQPHQFDAKAPKATQIEKKSR